MSIILKGIDLPSNAKVQIIVESPAESFRKQIPKSRVIQIPKGHGDIKDAGALKTVFEDMIKCEWNQKVSPISWAYAFEDTIDEIDNAPTILEAEE